ncbi:UNVERIFIED_CONTAM: hypothetical protein PYX00_003821 [Menopon gallinae]|uniref:Uncharacterized protein n=1 Tax=Menopon gallinae TaxID=328185 RepID=A0AAW2I1I1_9NEOP
MRRSNIPMERIKEMNFRIPAPVGRKSGIKKPVTRISRFQVGQSNLARASLGLNKSGLEPQGSNVVRPRQSLFWKPTSDAKRTVTTSVSSKKSEAGANASESFNQSVIQGATDVSLLSQSKVVNQSTPNEPAVLRSILRQNQSSNRGRKLTNSKKCKAAKRVNFNGGTKDDSSGKENEDNQRVGEKCKSPATAGFAFPAKPFQGVKKELCDIDEESTEVFSGSFKPISYQENSTEGNNHVPESRTEKEPEVIKPDESGDVIHGLMDFWKAYQNELNDIRTKLKMLDENFQKTCTLVVNSNVQERLTVYETEKWKLYEELKDLEHDFKEKVKSGTDINNLFANYIEKKEQIFKTQSELEERFESNLRAIAKRHWGEGEVVTDEAKESIETVASSDELGSASKFKAVSRPSVTRRKSGLPIVSKALQPSMKVPTKMSYVPPRRRTSKELNSTLGTTPENSPAMRDVLSKKIQQQLRILFEE